MMSRFLDQAIAAIALKKPKPRETAQNAWLLATSALVLTGGHPVVMAAQAAIHANLREHYGKSGVRRAGLLTVLTAKRVC